MLEEIHCDFSDFSKQVIKGETFTERKTIFWRCYAANPKKEDIKNMTVQDMVNYIKETDEFYEDDKKYVDACVALIYEKLESLNATSTNICCFCGQTFMGFGNNPYPASKNEEDRCCNDCNDDIVIPSRIKAIIKGDKNATNS